MKVKTKLTISFCIILFVPIILSLTLLGIYREVQNREVEERYGITGNENYSVYTTIQFLNEYLTKDFKLLQGDIEKDAEKITTKENLDKLNENLEDEKSYLVVKKNNDIIYNGGENNEKVIKNLPYYNDISANMYTATFVDGKKSILVKQINFKFKDSSKGCFYVVTKVNEIVPRTQDIFIDLLITIVVILGVTAIMLTAWVYRSLITPIKTLQMAAENIKEGNLDFEIEVEEGTDDEFGELCVTFEKMRQRLKDNAREKVNDEKENRALISNIAHDLKTPITAVKGYAEGIMDGVANTPEKVDKYIKTIYNKASEMDLLINELTLYSKIDTNRIPYNFTKLNVTDYYNDCIEEIGIDLEAKGIGLAYYNYANPEAVIVADTEQLRRVINNIVGNSVKYMDKTSGFINIRVKDVGDFIQTEIEDNGKGIAQKDLPYVFDRFYRADASRNSATGGSGIGLSIVKKIIEDHGGKIWATSKEGAGTTMYFVIRKYQEAQNE